MDGLIREFRYIFCCIGESGCNFVWLWFMIRSGYSFFGLIILMWLIIRLIFCIICSRIWLKCFIMCEIEFFMNKFVLYLVILVKLFFDFCKINDNLYFVVLCFWGIVLIVNVLKLFLLLLLNVFWLIFCRVKLICVLGEVLVLWFIFNVFSNKFVGMFWWVYVFKDIFFICFRYFRIDGLLFNWVWIIKLLIKKLINFFSFVWLCLVMGMFI